MRTYLWSDKLALGIEEVDEQHKAILVALRELQLAIYDQVSVEDITEKLVNINEYRGVHFATEERLMEPYKDQLKCYKAHVLAHKCFTESVEQFFVRYNEEGVAIAEELCEFLGQWLHTHINGLDKETGEALKALNAPYFK